MNRHFAALGDVWKHLTLAEILRLRPPLHYWETHAGSASYPLTALLNNSPTRSRGALRFLSRAPADPLLAKSNYLKLLRADPGNYPGSASLALRTLETEANYIFCDTDPASAASLRAAAAGLNANVLATDGVSAIAEASGRAEANPQDVLVHIDPFDPHERVNPGAGTPVELAGELAKAGYRLFYWYGYDSVDERGWALEAVGALAPEVDLWCGDLLIPAPFVYPGETGAWGCGIVLANMTHEETAVCRDLGQALERIYADDRLAGNDPPALNFKVIDR
jgi:hypothetical protein